MKKLHKYAILPKELYVEREADKFLARIVTERLKPGYISVSRQMGKSNLLLHAKEELENENNIFLYLDMSNPPYTSRECFQNIIDTLYETNSDKLEKAYNEILNKRKLISLTPSKEHENELKTILKHYNGNITIILDEVDALAKIEYSDEIFAQIRSVYFVRKTFPSFERLTYVLSGVIDPSKLIKNKDNSPFNIAEKIYLSDFDYLQFETFLGLAGLNFPKEVKDRIFFWLQGNPRMTYDICSELEDVILQGKIVVESTIDDIIKRIYLNKFDTPPVDHIRDLVKQNPDLRNGIVMMNYNQTNKINDEVIARMYLAGIVNNESKEIVKIKNEVIKRSLSEEWINQIELAQKGYFRIGEEQLRNGEYKEAIVSLESFLLNTNNAPKKTVKYANYYLGECYSKLGNYDKAEEYLLKISFDKVSEQKEYYRWIFLVAMNKLNGGSTMESVSYFDEIISDYAQGENYLNSLINKGIALNIESFENNYKESNELFHKAIEQAESFKDTISSDAPFKTLAFYQLGLASFKNKEVKEAKDFYFKALEYSETRFKPALLNYLFATEDDVDTKNRIMNELFDIIDQNDLKLDDQAISNLSLTRDLLYLILLELYEISNIELSQKLEDYAVDNLLIGVSKPELIFNVAVQATNYNEVNIANKLFRRVLDESNGNGRFALRSHLYLSLITYADKEFITHFRNYFKQFKESNNFNLPVDNLDLNTFINAIGFLREKNSRDYIINLQESFSFCLILEPFLKNISKDLEVDALVIYFYMADYYNYENSSENAITYAKIILEKCNAINENIQELNNAMKRTVALLEKNANLIISRHTNSRLIKNEIPIINANKYSRNEIVTVQYQEGKILTGKYKKFIYDIERGLCNIIS